MVSKALFVDDLLDTVSKEFDVFNGRLPIIFRGIRILVLFIVIVALHVHPNCRAGEPAQGSHVRQQILEGGSPSRIRENTPGDSSGAIFYRVGGAGLQVQIATAGNVHVFILQRQGAPLSGQIGQEVIHALDGRHHGRVALFRFLGHQIH